MLGDHNHLRKKGSKRLGTEPRYKIDGRCKNTQVLYRTVIEKQIVVHNVGGNFTQIWG